MPSDLLSNLDPATLNDIQARRIETDLRNNHLGKSNDSRDKALREACQGFEAIFLNFMLQEMRKTVPEGGVIPTSSAGRTWQQLFDNQLAENLARRQEMGVARMLYRQLQEGGEKK